MRAAGARTYHRMTRELRGLMSAILHVNERIDDRDSAGDMVRPYRRELPGGGFVAIDVQPVRSGLWRPRRYAGAVVVERRSAWRSGNHPSPVIARASGRSVEEVVQALLPAARSNEAIGAAFLRLSRTRAG
jgi:hypothetical protein